MSILKGAIEAAIQLEVDGERFYLESAAKAKTKPLRKMFEALAADERKHVNWIKALSPSDTSSEALNRELYEKLAPVFKDVKSQTPRNTASELEAIDFAISIEDKVIAIYSEWSKQDDDENIKKLGASLVAQERFHRQLLDNVKQYYSEPGNWFMLEERWSFDGG